MNKIYRTRNSVYEFDIENNKFRRLMGASTTPFPLPDMEWMSYSGFCGGDVGYPLIIIMNGKHNYRTSVIMDIVD